MATVLKLNKGIIKIIPEFIPSRAKASACGLPPIFVNPKLTILLSLLFLLDSTTRETTGGFGKLVPIIFLIKKYKSLYILYLNPRPIHF